MKFRWPWQKKSSPILLVSMSKKRELIQVGRTVRVENGPARKTAVATKKLLSDAITAPHYQEGAPDAMGKKIVITAKGFFEANKKPFELDKQEKKK